MAGFLLLLLAGALLVAGAEMFAENAARAGRQLGVSVLAVGLLLAGAEPEELFTAVLAAVRGRTAISVGDAFGANVTMLSAVVGAAALLRGVPVGGRVSRYLLGATLSSVVAALTTLNATVTRWEGGGLLALYVALVGMVWRLEQAPPAVGELAELGEGVADQADAPHAHRGTARGLLLAFVGIGVMAAGGWAAVEGAVRVVATLGVADGAVGATFVALATTAELFALVWSAARRDVEELAVAGIVGSAVYNATVTLGAPALIRPLDASDLRVVAWVAAGLPLLVLGLGGRRRRVPRVMGLALLAGYAAYVAFLLT
ncbi:MAG: sodium:calcium antiporter [Egibacteraceae bacterium]